MRTHLEPNLDSCLCIIDRRRIRGKQLGNSEMSASTKIVWFEQGLCLLAERKGSLAIVPKGLQVGTIGQRLSKHILLLMPLFGDAQRRRIFPWHWSSKCIDQHRLDRVNPGFQYGLRGNRHQHPDTGKTESRARMD